MIEQNQNAPRLAKVLQAHSWNRFERLPDLFEAQTWTDAIDYKILSHGFPWQPISNTECQQTQP